MIILFKKVMTLILIAALSAQAFNRVMIITDYYTNVAYYLQNCENKARPLLKCKGKCQMASKLNQEEKKDQQNPDRKGENKNELFSLNDIIELKILKITDPDKLFSSFQSGDPSDRSFPVFHPPSA